jgi:CRP-like cAMP-binding protein
MLEARLQLLKAMPIFGAVRADVLHFLLKIAPIVARLKGEFYFREHDEGDCMYVLERGSVAILKGWQGHEYQVNQLGNGDCFGEMAIMDLGRRGASVLALEDCSAIEISSGSLHKIYQYDLEQFTLIQMNMGREISRRLRMADQRLFEAKIEAILVEGEYRFHSV